MISRRQVLAVIVIGALGASVAACGSDGDAPPAARAASSTASVSTTTAPQALSPAQTRALAAKMLITAKDIGPAFKIDPPIDAAEEEVTVARRTPGCENVAEVFLGGKQRGISVDHAYTSGFDSYIATVSIFPDEAQARAYMTVSQSDEVETCARPVIETIVEDSLGALAEEATVTDDGPIEVTGIDVDDALASGTTVAVTAGGTVSKLALLSYTLRQGRVVGGLTLPVAASPAERQRLLTLFAKRLAAA